MIQHQSNNTIILQNGIQEDEKVLENVSFDDPSSLAQNPVTAEMESVGWTVLVSYDLQDSKYKISVNGIWFKDMPEAPPEPRELARIYRMDEPSTV